jgi:hypothetical protein
MDFVAGSSERIAAENPENCTGFAADFAGRALFC